MGLINLDDLHNFSSAMLKVVGVPSDDANIIADSIVYAHRSGNGTHGIVRLPIYINKINKGLMKADTPLEIVQEHQAISVIDANHGFGQVAGVQGMKMAMGKAANFGIGLVFIRQSNNFGTAGFIANSAVQKGMIGIVMANSAPAIAPTGGTKPIFGTNPIAFAFPSGDNEHTLILDMATSVAARGKIRMAARNGESIPMGWALDEKGLPTDDPNEALKGSMVPIGGHKGYGLSLVIDVLAGLLSGAGFAGSVQPLNCQDGFSDNGHLVIAIDISCFIEMDEYKAKMEQMFQKTKECGEKGEVHLPGDPALYPPMAGNQIQVKSDLINDLNKLAESLGVVDRITNNG